MLLAAGWTWPATVLALALIAGATCVCMVIFATPFTKASPGIGPGRLKEIEEDLVAIREDLADIKDSLAELDRLFKSVG